MKSNGISCAVNAKREKNISFINVLPAKNKRKIVVVGAGLQECKPHHCNIQDMITLFEKNMSWRRPLLCEHT